MYIARYLNYGEYLVQICNCDYFWWLWCDGDNDIYDLGSFWGYTWHTCPCSLTWTSLILTMNGVVKIIWMLSPILVVLPIISEIKSSNKIMAGVSKFYINPASVLMVWSFHPAGRGPRHCHDLKMCKLKTTTNPWNICVFVFTWLQPLTKALPWSANVQIKIQQKVLVKP